MRLSLYEGTFDCILNDNPAGPTDGPASAGFFFPASIFAARVVGF